MPFKNSNVGLKIVNDREFALLEPLEYEGRDENFLVPAGFVTDFASVPAIVQWLIPTYGKYTLAAIVHDYLCVDLAQSYDNGHYGTPPLASARDTDGIFRRIMRELGVPPIRRWLMWTGVRWGAMFNAARRPGILKDVPLMLLISLLALPLVAPVSLLVAVGLLIDNLVERIT